VIAAFAQNMGGLAMRLSIAVALAGISALLAWPAQAAVVFDNLNLNVGKQPFASPGGDPRAAGFIPTANYDFTGASALIANYGNNTETFSMALYSSTASGTPGSPLWPAAPCP
jgi:hypothetical protein